MRIVFNLIGVGLGNNGGSATLVKSADTLLELGHDVIIIDSGACKYTWNEIKTPFKRVKDVNDVNGDVIIATGIYSVKSTNQSKIKNKFHYIRGLEVWNVPENNLIKILRESPTKKIVNSVCLQRRLKKFNIKSDIIRPGHDFNRIYPLDIRKDNKKIILGGLYNQGSKRSTKRTNWIFETYQFLKEQYDIELYMFGSDGEPFLFVNKYFKTPKIEEKNRIYNSCDIWLSTSCLEGLHITPAEAMLTKCAVVGNNSDLSGTEDYLIDHETGLVSKDDFKSFLSNVEILIKHKNLRKEFGEKGREKVLSLGDRKENMIKMIEIFERKNSD